MKTEHQAYDRTSESHIQAVAKSIAAKLFRNGFGQDAERLVMLSAEGKDLGGWCRSAVARVIAEELMRNREIL